MSRFAKAIGILLSFAAAPLNAGEKDVLRYAAGLGVDRLNPMLASHGWCEVSSMIFSRLYRAGHDGQMEFDLLESADFSDDALTLTLGLKRHVTWHDGQPFTARDVIFTFERLFDPQTPTDYDKDLRSIKSFKADGDHRVIITFSRPDPHLDGRLSEVPILPEHLLRNQNLATTRFNNHPIGTGPYAFDRAEPDGAVWLKAHPSYHGGQPRIPRVRVQHVPDDADRARLIATKQADIGSVKPQHRDILTPLGDNAVKRYQTGAWRALVLNHRAQPTSNPHVRAAIADAIDRKPIVEHALDGFGQPALVPIVPGSWAYPTDLNLRPSPTVEHDLKSRLRLIVWKDETFRMRTAEILKEQLSHLGIDVELRLFDNRGYNQHASDMGTEFNGFIGGWGGLTDPVGNIYRKFHSKGSQNHADYSNPDVDRLIDQAMRTVDRPEAAKLMSDAIKIVLNDVVFIPLVYPDYLFAVSRPIKGLPKGPIDSWYEVTKHAHMWSFE